MGAKMASGQKLEPSPIAGKAPFINAKVQAANDGENLYLRFTWKQPAASGAAPMDAANPVKIAYMLEGGSKVELAEQGGCWGSCHGDARTMPGAVETKTKYVKGGSLADGVFYDLNQWRSGENKAFDGYVAGERVMEAGRRWSVLRASSTATPGRWSSPASSPAARVTSHWHPAASTTSASPSTTTAPPVVSTMSRWATRWASTPRATSPPPSSKPSGQQGPAPRRPFSCAFGNADTAGGSWRNELIAVKGGRQLLHSELARTGRDAAV